MSDLISRKALIESVKTWDMQDLYLPTHFIYLIENEPSVTDTNVGNKWIPCSERMPEERESIFKKAKGTDKWRVGMFEGISDDVNVTVEFEDGRRKAMTSHTTDGRWKCEKEYGIRAKVVAWMPLPEVYEGDKRE